MGEMLDKSFVFAGIKVVEFFLLIHKSLMPSCFPRMIVTLGPLCVHVCHPYNKRFVRRTHLENSLLLCF